MKKLADISAFESLQNQSPTAISTLSVFNGEFTDEVVEAFKNKTWRDPDDNWTHYPVWELGIFIGQKLLECIKKSDISLDNYSLKDLLSFVSGEVSDVLYALDDVEEVKLPRNSLNAQDKAIYLVLHKLAREGVGEWGKKE